MRRHRHFLLPRLRSVDFNCAVGRGIPLDFFVLAGDVGALATLSGRFPYVRHLLGQVRRQDDFQNAKCLAVRLETAEYPGDFAAESFAAVSAGHCFEYYTPEGTHLVFVFKHGVFRPENQERNVGTEEPEERALKTQSRRKFDAGVPELLEPGHQYDREKEHESHSYEARDGHEKRFHRFV